jgi:threonine dehydrogenase-like Zn-dependent dehydrogenase
MFSVAVLEPNKIAMVRVPDPEPGPYQARVRTELACLCNATDRKLVQGHFPGIERYPLLLGHETVGIVDAVGDKVRSFRVGDRLVGGLLLQTTDPAYASGWGGFSEYTLAGDHDAMVADGVATPEHDYFEVYEIMRVVAPDIPVEAALLLCTWREVYAAFADFSLQAGDDILVFGGGPVGLSFVKFARLLGLGWIGLVDPLPEKREKAIRNGADAAFSPARPGYAARAGGDAALGELTRSRGKALDRVIDAVGSESIINAALPLIRMAGSVCVYGVIDHPVLNLQKGFGPYNFNLLIHQWPTRAREACAQEPLCDWIRQGVLDSAEFISAEFPVAQIEQALRLSDAGRTLKMLLRF